MQARTAAASVLELALAHPEQADWPATAARLLAEDERMEQLVADLLLLAQCDEADFSSPTAPAEIVALDAIVRDEAVRLGRRWTVGVDVGVDVPPGGGAVAGRPEHLARAERNLLESAARRARPAATVSLRAHPARARPATRWSSWWPTTGRVSTPTTAAASSTASKRPAQGQPGREGPI